MIPVQDVLLVQIVQAVQAVQEEVLIAHLVFQFVQIAIFVQLVKFA